MEVVNTLPYYDTATITTVKSFIVQALVFYLTRVIYVYNHDLYDDMTR
jgi:hypothetical protein